MEKAPIPAPDCTAQEAAIYLGWTAQQVGYAAKMRILKFRWAGGRKVFHTAEVQRLGALLDGTAEITIREAGPGGDQQWSPPATSKS